MNARQYFQDKTMFSLFVGSIFFAVIGVLAVILRVHSSEVLVPIRYLATNDIQRANWLNLYLFALFLVVSCVLHIVVSMRLFAVRRGYAYAMLGVYILIAILTLRISGAVISLYY